MATKLVEEDSVISPRESLESLASTTSDGGDSTSSTSDQTDKVLKRSPKKWNKAFFFVLNFVQGFLTSYGTLAPVYLASELGASNSVIGVVVSLSTFASATKIPMCILSDRYSLLGYGHRKPYILLGVFFTGCGFITLGILDYVRNIYLYCAISVSIALLATLFDGVVDGLTVESVPKSEAGNIQGKLTAIRSLGIVVTIVIFGYVAEHATWSAVFFIMGGSFLATLSMLPKVVEMKDIEREKFEWGRFRAMLHPTVLGLIYFTVAVQIPMAVSRLIISLFLQSPDYFDQEEGAVSTFLVMAALGTIVGAPLTGWAIDKYRKHFRVTISIAVCMGLLTFVAFIVGGLYPKQLLYAMYPILFMAGICMGSLMAAHLSMTMLLVDPAISGSFFGIMMTISDFATSIGQAVSGVLVDHFGFINTYVFCFFFCLLALPGLLVVFKTLPSHPIAKKHMESAQKEEEDVTSEMLDENSAKCHAPDMRSIAEEFGSEVSQSGTLSLEQEDDAETQSLTSHHDARSEAGALSISESHHEVTIEMARGRDAELSEAGQLETVPLDDDLETISDIDSPPNTLKLTTIDLSDVPPTDV